VEGERSRRFGRGFDSHRLHHPVGPRLSYAAQPLSLSERAPYPRQRSLLSARMANPKKAETKTEAAPPEAPAPRAERVLAVTEWLYEARLDPMIAAALAATHRDA